MDCLICYKIFIQEIEFKDKFPNSKFCVNLFSKLINASQTSKFQEILQDFIICERCYRKFEEADEAFTQIEELEKKIDKIRIELLNNLTNSKNISQVVQKSYGGQISKSSLTRLKIFEEIFIGESPDKSVDITEEMPSEKSANSIISSQSNLIPIGPKLDHSLIISPEIENESIADPPKINIKVEKQEQEPRAKKKPKSDKKFHYSMYFYCKICKKRYSSKASLSRHMEKHDAKPNQKALKKCNKIFPSEFTCQECGCPHKSEADLATHLENALTSKEIQKCPSCPEEFWGSECLSFHQKNSHVQKNKNIFESQLNDKPEPGEIYKCPVCGLKFGNRSTLYNHRLIHGPKKFKCTECEMKFHRKDAMKSHVVHCGKSNQEYPKQCVYCKRGFLQNRQLVKHLGNKEETECKICQEKFKSIGCLKHHNSIIHMIRYVGNVNTSIKDFKCTKCGHFYSSKRSLDIHKVTHGTKKYKCPDCGKLFAVEYYLKRHMNTVH